MIDAHLDDLLDRLVPAEPCGRWDDVLRRARRSRRRYVAAVVTGAALLLAPAAWAITRAFEGKPAPQSIKSMFLEHDKASAAFAKALGRREPKAIASKAHGVIQVQTADGPLDLWAAPATDGGTCYFVGWQADIHRNQAFGASSCVPATAALNNAQSSAHNLAVSWGGSYGHTNYRVVQGYAYGRAARVRISLTNGSSKTLPVVEGFFLGALRQSHWRLRPKVVSVVSRDAQGHVVGYLRLPRR
jgi:hypothetical protein